MPAYFVNCNFIYLSKSQQPLKTMGFLNQNNILHKSIEVGFDSVVHLIKARFKQNKLQNEVEGRIKPAVVVDASLIGFLFLSKSCGPVGGLRILCKSFIKNYIDVHLVVDGPNRHHSKRATIKRQGIRTQARISAAKKRIELSTAILEESTSNCSKGKVKKLQQEVR